LSQHGRFGHGKNRLERQLTITRILRVRPPRRDAAPECRDLFPYFPPPPLRPPDAGLR
jgi:hypothetical protein